MDKYLLGIDVGTGSTRCAIFDLSGNLLVDIGEREEYLTYRKFQSWAEQDPNDWWKAVRKGLNCLFDSNVVSPEEIAAIGVGGQTNGHVLVDSKGQSLGRAIIWQDRRAIKEATKVKEKLSSLDMAKYLGTYLPIDASTIPARMLWLQRYEPEKIAKAVVMLQPKDFINYRLTDNFATDWASCKTIIDLKQNIFHNEYFSLLGLERRLIPEAFPPHGVIGTVTKNAAVETGLSTGTPVVAGSIDAWCNILGSGAVSPGISSDVSGSSEVITVFSNSVEGTTLLNVIPSFDGYLINGPTQSGGDSLKWFKDNFAPPEELNAPEAYGYNWFDQLAYNTIAGAGGLIFMPYLQGERAPIWDSNARGIFIGITKKHGYKEFVRSILEGIAFSIRHVLETAEMVGKLKVQEIRVSGGGAKSAVWNQIKADITGKVVRVPKVLNNACLGVALIAGVGVGCYPSYAVAAQSAVQISMEYKPNIKNQQRYQDLYKIYRQLYPNLKELFYQLAEVSS